ncbi:MAG: flagellar filament capping protein FliD [Candidatus Marinimicrobia bacterium]|nr:flagellar filament capping protein FliD [Candidatus Neomarinimicrobiota bacterium]
MDINSLLGSQNSIQYLVDQYMKFESRPKDALLDRQYALNQRKDTLSDLDSKLSALQSKAERLSDPVTDYFAARSASTSDGDVMTATAGATAALGNHAITIDRLAISDTRVSQQYTDGDSSFSGFLTDQTFSIEVGAPTDEDANNRVSISMTVSAADLALDNDEALLQIADAINSAMYTAVSDETIGSEEQVRASVVTEESGKSRLVLRSESSGYTYRMEFTDSADGLLSALGVSDSIQSSGSAGGYITDVGTSTTTSLLNSKFNIDGLDFYRDSNNVTDALAGVSIKMLDTSAATQTITVVADTEGVKTEVNGFIDAYNEAMTYLREETQMNPDTYERGMLADDVTYRGIVYDLRNFTLNQVSGVSNTDYSRLFSIGIEADSQGMLSIADMDKFTTAIETNSNYVAELFNSADGLATQLDGYLENYVKTGGSINSSKNNIDDQLMNLTDRISLMDDILYRREDQLRQEFTSLQEMMYKLQSQQSFLGSFFQ